MNGACYAGNVALLTTGHETAIFNLAIQANPLAPPSAAGSDKGAPIVILGTRLTMVDCVLSLSRDGHPGPIIAMSQRGLLSKMHCRVDPLRIEETDVPFGAGASRLLYWFRNRIHAPAIALA